MGKESVILGTLLVIFGIALYYKGAPKIPSIILAIFGLILILFSNAEDKIEERTDIKKKKK